MQAHQVLDRQDDHFKLARVDPDKKAFASKEQAQDSVAANVKALSDLQEKLFAEGKHAVLILFQGMDTSGKDSMIKHVMSGVNPQGCKVHSFKAPTAEEISHGYLWRHSAALPAKGRIGIFNRSYYEEVTIARVHKEVLESENVPQKNHKTIWAQRYEEINNFEKYLVANGFCLLKFFLHISGEEQTKRLLKRVNDPDHHWKFDVSDIREREFWNDYQNAYEQAFIHTSSAWAPWHIIPADDKWDARATVSGILVRTLQTLNPQFPKLTPEGERNLARAKKLLLHG